VQCRFVAREDLADGSEGPHLVTGATFPVLRMQALDDRTQPNAWIEVVEQRLQEMDTELRDRGLRRLPGVGAHWWSRAYVLDPSDAGSPATPPTLRPAQQR
jgi:hypothetical protein